MERIIRVATVFAITTLVGLMSIIIANGDLTWATVGLMVIVALIIGLGFGVWTIVHHQFPTMAEIGITVGIVCGIIGVFVLAGIAGKEIYSNLKDVVGAGSAWWLLSPIAGTVAITLTFGLHSKRGRR